MKRTSRRGHGKVPENEGLPMSEKKRGKQPEPPPPKKEKKAGIDVRIARCVATLYAFCNRCC